MPRSSLASAATTSGTAFDIDLPDSAGEDASVSIYFCGRPARSTGVVNLRLLLGDHGYVLTERRRMKDADGSSAAEHDEGGATATGKKKEAHSTYHICSSVGLPAGCFRVKHGRHYWVMRVGDGAAPSQTPSPRTATEHATEHAASPSPPSPFTAAQPHRASPESSSQAKNKEEAKKTRSRKTQEAPAEAKKSENDDTVQSRRKRSRHAMGDDGTSKKAARAEESTEADDAGHEAKEDDDNSMMEGFNAVEAASSTAALDTATTGTAQAKAPSAAEATDDVVGDVEATLGDLFLSSSTSAFSKPSSAEVAAQVSSAAEETASQCPGSSKRIKEGTVHDEDKEKSTEATEAEGSADVPLPVSQRRGGLGAAAAVVMRKSSNTKREQTLSASLKSTEINDASPKKPEREPEGEKVTVSSVPAGERRGKREKKTTAAKAGVVVEVPPPPAPQQQQQQPQSSLSLPLPRRDMPSPAIRPPSQPEDPPSKADHTPLHAPRRSNSGGVDTTSPTLLYSNRSSGAAASSHLPPSPQQQQHQLQPPPATSASSASASTRLARLTSPRLREQQQQYAQRGSSGGGGGDGTGGSLSLSDTGSFNMIPQDSPALGFTQVHNTLAEEFSLDPSEGASSSTVSEYLYDVEG